MSYYNVLTKDMYNSIIVMKLSTDQGAQNKKNIQPYASS